MQPKKKPSIGIILLIIFLAWSIYNLVGRIFLFQHSTDVAILNQYSLDWAGYIIIFAILILSIASLPVVITKKKYGVAMLYALFALNVFFTVAIAGLSLLDFENTKEIYAISREERNMSAENINSIMSPGVVLGMTSAYVIFYSLLAFYIHKKKDYFIK
jgi:hypothetical protein